MFTVIWDEIDAFADAPAVEREREFDTLRDAVSWAEMLERDFDASGVTVWDDDADWEVEWPW